MTSLKCDTAGLAGDGLVLELAIGTGRVALPLAGRGIAVEGIDASEAMVARLRARAVSRSRLSSGDRDRQAARYLALQQRMARQHKKSRNRERTRRAMAGIAAEVTRRRQDWAEKISTRLVAGNNVIVLEKLNTKGMVRKPEPKPDPGQPGAFLPNRARAKAGLSRGILAACWGTLSTRLEQKTAASGATALFVNPRFSSQECRAWGHTDPRHARAKRSSPVSRAATQTMQTPTQRKTYSPGDSSPPTARFSLRTPRGTGPMPAEVRV